MRHCVVGLLMLGLACGREEAAAPAPAPAPTPAPANTPAPAPASSTPPHRVESGARVRVLGIAQDGGLPHAACNCERCEAARRDPTRASPVASLAITGGTQTWLVDATPDLPAQLDMLARSPTTSPGVDRHPLDGILLTHAHMGHYLGLAWLGYEAIAARGVDVWGSASMIELLRNNAPWDQLVRLANIVPHVAAPEQEVVLDAAAGVRARGFAVPHRGEYTDTFAWQLAGPRGRVLWLPDCDPWTKWARPLDELLDGVDLLLVDGTFHAMDELPGRNIAEIGHPLIVDTMDLLQARVDAGTLAVWFVHLNHSNPALDPDSPSRRALEQRGFRVASVGDEWPL